MAAHETAEVLGHCAVMVDEVTEILGSVPSGVLLDATIGAGGHTAALAERRADLSLIGLDRDPTALELAAERLGGRVRLVQGCLGDLEDVLDDALDAAGAAALSGVIFDLGVSSMQLDDPGRGFSYRASGPIDMRMDPRSEPSAAQIVNEWPTERLAEALRCYGDEPQALRIATAIVARRPFGDTLELAEAVRAAVPAPLRRHGGHPARRSFQALRIAVNDELSQIAPALRVAIGRLVPGGRGVVLSYHSGEDRVVKTTLRDAAGGGCVCPPKLPCRCGAKPSVRLLDRRPRRPGRAEVQDNPRARSARLRSFEKLPEDVP